MNAGAVAAALGGKVDAVRARPARFIRLPGISTDPAYAEGMHGAQKFPLYKNAHMLRLSSGQ